MKETEAGIKMFKDGQERTQEKALSRSKDIILHYWKSGNKVHSHGSFPSSCDLTNNLLFVSQIYVAILPSVGHWTFDFEIVCQIKKKKIALRGTGVAESVKRWTLRFSSGHISGLWNQAPHPALHSAGSLLEILSSFCPFPSSLVLSLSRMNK